MLVNKIQHFCRKTVILLRNPVKLINRMRAFIDIKHIRLKPRCFPIKMTLALSNVCNYSCPICSINNLRNKVERVTNNISLDQLKAFSPLFKRVEYISFMGMIGESVLNPEFVPIVKYLKSQHQILLFLSTNGFGVDESVQDIMVDTGFDSVTFSIHAATPETYQILQGAHFNDVLTNLASLQRKKNLKGTAKPRIAIVYAVNRANIGEMKKMVDIACELNIEKLRLYHYHDYGENELAFGDDVDFANNMLDDVYSYAKGKNAPHLLPQNPPYYKGDSFEKEPDVDEIPCYLPWKSLQMRSSYSHPNSLYLGCCNVFNAFLFNFEKHISYYGEVDIIKIWHHPVFQYLRRTVNTNDKYKRNALCQYCKSKRRSFLKNTNNKKNYEIKLQVIHEFFESAKTYFNGDLETKVEGLEILYTEDDELRALAG